MDIAAMLREAIEQRRLGLEIRLRELRSTLRDDRLALAAVLDLLSFFPVALKQVVDAEWARNPSADSRVQLLRPLLQHTTEVATFVDEWMAHQGSSDFPFYLLDAVERECEELGLGERKAVIAASVANNFFTFPGELEAGLFNKLGPLCPPVPSDLRNSFALLRAPRLEGRLAWWHPILLGHELAHLACRAYVSVVTLDLGRDFDVAKAQTLVGPNGEVPGVATAVRLLEIAESWAEELICDAHAVQVFGVAGVAAMSEFLEAVGATDHLNESHPPGRLRNRLLVNWLGTVASARIEAVAEPWRQLSAESISYKEAWAQFIVDFMISRADDIYAAARAWTTIRDEDGAAGVVEAAAECMRVGMPPEPTVMTGGKRVALTIPDVVAAAWIGRIEAFDTPVGRLAEKSMSDLEFMRRWGEAGGTWPVVPPHNPTSPPESAVLSKDQLEGRIFATDESRLVVTPLLPDFASGASLDLRLGNGFIVFVGSHTPSFDPLQIDRDPRQVQRSLELAWGDNFVLHPSEMVLAATLEYLVFPPDLTAQVISRSSYGRLGLLSATAVQVHPNFHGCLTLELVNLGTVPIVLTPGERIAQLVVSPSGKVDPGKIGKYHCPIGPEFSRVRSDREADVLRNLTEP